MMWGTDTAQVIELNKAAGIKEARDLNYGKSRAIYYAERRIQYLPGSLFRVIGLGLGIAGLFVTGLTLLLAPVLVVEPNQWIRVVELFWIGVGIAGLVAELIGARH